MFTVFFLTVKRMLISSINRWKPYFSSTNVCFTTSHQDTSVQMSVPWSVFFPFCFISMDRGSFLSWNVSLIIRIWRRLLLLIGGM